MDTKTLHSGHFPPLLLLTALLLPAPAASAQTPAWTRLSPADSPSPRLGHAMAFDTARQRVVLLGGWNRTTPRFGDTWEWDGRAWHWRFPATSPTARDRHAMAYDAAR
jgi:hypothetical protein